jgi:hypothetical protein
MQWLSRFIRWLFDKGQTTLRWLIGEPDTESRPVTPQVVAEPELPLPDSGPPRYAKRRSILTRPEQGLFEHLQREVGSEYLVFAKVRLGDVMYLQNLPENRKFHNNQIQCKHFDFVLCHPRSHEPLLAIELNDESHTHFNRMESDAFKRGVCAEIGLPLLSLQVGERRPPGDLARRVYLSLGRAASPPHE